MQTERLVFTGSVDAPDYLDWIAHRATRLGLRGWVIRPEPSRVEVVVHGAPDLIDAMEIGCSLGPITVLVDAIEREPADDLLLPNGFAIRPSIA
ncbi:MAG: acylphosphatase [Pseudomonadota bacterium]